MKILILFCGGTLIMKKNQEGSLEVPGQKEAIQTLLDLEPRLNQVAHLDVHYIANIDSTNMKPEYWDEMTKVIALQYENYDGFVITHGTDSMAYTSSALSFSLQNLGKPVILTGSQIPGEELATDAKRNFVNSVKLATLDISGVFIVFNERVILGARASKISESALDGFATINGEDVGNIRVEMRLSEEISARHEHPLRPQMGFESNISCALLTPGSKASHLISLIEDTKIRGLILGGYGSGNIPYDYHLLFEKAQKNRVPVVVRSQCLHGRTTMKYYDVGFQALKLGVIEGHDLSLEAASTKLMWAISHYSYEEIPTIMHTNYVGELTIKPKQSYIQV